MKHLFECYRSKPHQYIGIIEFTTEIQITYPGLNCFAASMRTTLGSGSPISVMIKKQHDVNSGWREWLFSLITNNQNDSFLLIYTNKTQIKSVILCVRLLRSGLIINNTFLWLNLSESSMKFMGLWNLNVYVNVYQRLKRK